MSGKKMILVAAVLLLGVAGAAIVAGAGKVSQQQVPPATVVGAPPQPGDTGVPAVPNPPALPPAAGTVSFSDSFDSSQLNDWRNLPEATGTWVVRDGHLQSWGNTTGDLADDRIALTSKFSDFGDGIFEAQVYPSSGEPVGVLFRGSDAGYYRLNLYINLPGSGPKATLEKLGPGGSGVTEVASNTTWAGFTLARWQRIEVKTVGGRIIVGVDGAQLLDVTDAGLKSGWIGVWSVADRGALFDNVRVQRAVAGR